MLWRSDLFTTLVPNHADSLMPQVSGIEGSFRHTCEITMQVLRANKESLMAVLEAFVYDPLINWRLMQAEVDARRPDGALSLLIMVYLISTEFL